MKKKIFSLLSVLLIATLLATPVAAGGGIKLSSVTFSLGSLIAEGLASGVGRTDVTFVLDATGTADITCTNNGSNSVPGQSSPKISAVGTQDVLGSAPETKNGKTPFRTETDDPETLAWDVAGCPNANWIGQVDFIYWTNAILSIYATDTGAFLASQEYTCVTTRFPASVTCTPVQ